jgi:acetyl esterase/lipase
VGTYRTRKPTASPARWYCRPRFVWPISIVLGLALVGVLAFRFSPWPSILLVRSVFGRGDRRVLAALEKHTPSTPITMLANQQYKPGDGHARLDVYFPASTSQALPTVIWTHGGAWVSGDKANSGPYYKLLAAKGFTVVSLNYTLAPEKTYPAQLFELNDAHAYLLKNAAQFHIDTGKIFLAGDSAGAHLSSEMAALATNPAYAKEVGITPALQPSQLAGVALFCGIYKMAGLVEADPNLPKIVSWGDDQVVWAFSGTRNQASPVIRQMSPYYYVTPGFPAAFISGGNGDPLTTKQSMPLAAKLSSLQVPVTTLFYSANHQPSLPHEYQFNLDTADGQNALAQLTLFLQSRLSAKHYPL